MTLCIRLCAFPMHLQSISDALPHTLMHCIADSVDCLAPHCPCMCHFLLFVYLFVYLCHWRMCHLHCLFISPSRLFPLIDGEQHQLMGNRLMLSTHSIKKGPWQRIEK